ncbi:MAG: hypothetical protein ABL879_19460, partial [Devosia sp.]
LGSCNGANQKLLYNSTTDKFECGTISAGASTFSTGNVLTIGDARYLRRSGGTMTGALVVDITGGNPQTLGLDVKNTVSGSRLIVSGNASVSGSLLVKNSLTSRSVISGASIVSSGNANIFGNLTSLRTISGSRLIISGHSNISGSLLVRGALTSRSVISGASIISSGNTNVFGNFTTLRTISGSRLVVSGHTNISGALLVRNNITTRGTLSGYNLTVSRSASISGTLIVKTGITSKGSVSGSTIDGFGLGSCNGASQKLLYNATTDKFECGTITAGASTFSTGNVLTIGDARYLRRSGGTMTGALVVDITGGNSQTLGLNVRNTISGSRLIVSGHANISGSLLVQMNIMTRGSLSGEILYANKILSSSGLLMVTQKQIRGSGALVVDQRANSTGAFISVNSTTNKSPVLVLENNRISTQSPHIMFGYRGTFDVSMRR